MKDAYVISLQINCRIDCFDEYPTLDLNDLKKCLNAWDAISPVFLFWMHGSADLKDLLEKACASVL
jgi:hypothetical protein